MLQPLLIFPNFKKPFQVHCDAMSKSLGAVLSQQEGHPNAFKTRCLHDQEKILGIYEKALFAIIHALDT